MGTSARIGREAAEPTERTIRSGTSVEVIDGTCPGANELVGRTPDARAFRRLGEFGLFMGRA